jgi:protein phosphatase
MMLTVVSRTHPGAVRAINEDSFLWDADLGLLVVADGMGGHNAGEVASKLAVDTVRAVLQKHSEDDDATWPGGINPSLSFNANRLLSAVKLANRRVFRAAEDEPDYNGMGTTIVAALVEGSRLTFANVGDSRLYAFSGSALTQLTTDDSWVGVLQRESGLDASAFATHPMRHVLTSVIGARADVDVPVKEVDLASGVTLLFCSDGLYGGLTNQMIRSILDEESELERAAQRLVDQAVARDGGDNVTVLLARYSE